MRTETLGTQVAPRNTNTGGVLEAMVIPALRRGGYQVTTQETIGTRPGGRKHKVDCIARKDDTTVLVSLKWQQASGTAEQKVPYEVISLIKAVEESATASMKAYLVLGGNGWVLKDFYISEGLELYIPKADLVKIVGLEEFVGLANDTKL